MLFKKSKGASFTMGSGDMSGLRPSGSIDCLKGLGAPADPKGDAGAGPALNGLSALTGRPVVMELAKGLTLAVHEEREVHFQNSRLHWSRGEARLK